MVSPQTHWVAGWFWKCSATACMQLAAILFAGPVGQMLFMTTNDLDALISAATVDNNVFEIRILLIEDRPNRLFEKLSLIIGRCDDAELWRHDLDCAVRSVGGDGAVVIVYPGESKAVSRCACHRTPKIKLPGPGTKPRTNRSSFAIRLPATSARGNQTSQTRASYRAGGAAVRQVCLTAI